MPHIIIEHSADFKNSKMQELGLAIQDTLIQTGEFKIEQCRIRNIAFENFYIGKYDESKSSFIHVTIKILTGRDLIIRQTITENSFKLVKNKADELASNNSIAIDSSVDLAEMEKSTYQKFCHIKS